MQNLGPHEDNYDGEASAVQLLGRHRYRLIRSESNEPVGSHKSFSAGEATYGAPGNFSVINFYIFSGGFDVTGEISVGPGLS